MKIRKNIFKYLGVAVISGGLLLACNEEFLDAPPQGSLDSGTLANQFGVESSLIATYSLLDGFANFGGWGAAGSNWIFGSAASDDAYKGSEPGDQQPTTDVELFQWGTGGTDGYLNDKWRIVFDGAARANATLNLMSTVEEISDADRSRISGEATFLRAHYHFEAYKYWGNIPYYTEADDQSNTDGFRKENSSDALPLILADLDAAISSLPESQADIGRVTQWTAKAYKGRVQAYTGDFNGAKSTLDDVVNNGPYALRDCFHDVFSAAEENGSETVLAYQASSNDGDSGGANGNRNDRLNFPHGGSPFGCCGFHQPSQNLVNAFVVDENGLPANDNSFDDLLPVDTPVDPRLDWTAGRDDVPFLDWGAHAPGWIRDRAWAGPYSPKKNIYEANAGVGSSVGWANYQLHSMNMHIYRYAEVLLLLAEAEMEVGSLERAREIVNEVRTRAGNCAQGPGTDASNVEVPIDDPSITWANYQIGTYDEPWTDKEAARQAVYTENRLELAMEGHRFFNLRRWGIAEQVLNDYIDVEKNRRNYLTGAARYEGRHQLYPIPIVQIELSQIDGKDRLVQNPGW
ncbi:MAG: RagB/SusD family nutrient uptake outer membrane protein [Bacteroidota bacterium]